MKPGISVKHPVWIILIIVLFASCRSSRNVTRTTGRANVMPVEELIGKIKTNSFGFTDFTIKRINCQYADNNGKTSFVASLKAEKDKKILISVTKLNIPVGRVLLTPDSVKYVNYIQQNYFTDDYSYLGQMLNTELNFDIIQAIVENDAVSVIEMLRKTDNDLKTDVENNLQVIENLNRKNPNARKYKLSFEPETYSLKRLLIDDNAVKRRLVVQFNETQLLNDKVYPLSAEMDFTSEKNKVNISLRYNGLSTDKIEPFGLNIPADYQKISFKQKTNVK